MPKIKFTSLGKTSSTGLDWSQSHGEEIIKLSSHIVKGYREALGKGECYIPDYIEKEINELKTLLELIKKDHDSEEEFKTIIGSKHTN